MKINNKKNNKGFTLIELMVATTIFVIIMLSSMGALFMLLDASKNSRALRSAMDNINFSMESMTRSIRMGTNYYCVLGESGIVMIDNPDANQDCLDGGNFIAFIPQDFIDSDPGTRVGYKLSEIVEGTNIGNYTIKRCEGNNCVSIISPDVNIETLRFFVKGSALDDDIQASAFIIIKGTVLVKGVPTSFSIQTMASQRNF